MGSVGRIGAAVAAAHARVRGAGRHRTYGLLEFAGGEDRLRPPYVAVFALDERGGPNLSPGADLTGALDADDDLGRSAAALHAPSPTTQRVEATLAVVCCVAARRQPEMRQLDDDAAPRREGDADDRMAALVAAVRGALVGWLPSPAWWPLELARGRLVAMEGGRAHWQDEYRTSYLLSGGGAAAPETPAATEVCVAENGGAHETIVAP